MDVGTFGCRSSSPRPRLPPRRLCPPLRGGQSEGPWPRVGAGTDSACTRPRLERRVTSPASTVAPSVEAQPRVVTRQSVDVPVVQMDDLVLTSLKINPVQIVSDILNLVTLEVSGRRFDGTAVVGLNTSAQVRQAAALVGILRCGRPGPDDPAPRRLGIWAPEFQGAGSHCRPIDGRPTSETDLREKQL